MRNALQHSGASILQCVTTLRRGVFNRQKFHAKLSYNDTSVTQCVYLSIFLEQLSTLSEVYVSVHTILGAPYTNE